MYNNFDKKNLYSHTIFIENSLLSSWKHVLQEKLGIPKDNGNNGLIHQVSWQFDNKKPQITVTLYISTSKLHVQGNATWVDIYCKIKLPKLYSAVRIHHQGTLGILPISSDSSSASNPKERESRPRSIKKDRCQEATVKNTVMKEIQEHRENNKKEKYDEKRNLNDSIEMEEVETVEVEAEIHDTEESFDKRNVDPMEQVIEEAFGPGR